MLLEYPLVLIVVVALVLYQRKSLTLSGAVGVLGIGAAVVMKLGGTWLLIVGALFACIVAVTKVNDRRTGGFKKSSARGLLDLLPVGGAITGSALLADTPLAQQFTLAALSFALADIFASELGPAFGSPTAILLPTLQQVPHGTPGAVSLAGFAFGAVGSLLPAGIAFVLSHDPWAAMAVFWGGQLGAFGDGVLQRLVPRAWPLRSDLINGAGVVIALAIASIHSRGLCLVTRTA